MALTPTLIGDSTPQWFDTTNARSRLFEYSGKLFALVIDQNPSYITVKTSTDGLTWTEVDAANRIAPPGGLGVGMAGIQVGSTLHVAYVYWDAGINSEIRIRTFNLATEAWGSDLTGGPSAAFPSFLDFGDFLVNGSDYLVAFKDNATRDLYYASYSGGIWSGGTLVAAGDVRRVSLFRSSDGIDRFFWIDGLIGGAAPQVLHHRSLVGGVLQTDQSIYTSLADNFNPFLGNVVEFGGKIRVPFAYRWQVPGTQSYRPAEITVAPGSADPSWDAVTVIDSTVNLVLYVNFLESGGTLYAIWAPTNSGAFTLYAIQYASNSGAGWGSNTTFYQFIAGDVTVDGIVFTQLTYPQPLAIGSPFVAGLNLFDQFVSGLFYAAFLGEVDTCCCYDFAD